MLFQNLTNGLSNTKVNFLKALINDVEQLSAKEVIAEYGLGTSGVRLDSRLPGYPYDYNRQNSKRTEDILGHLMTPCSFSELQG